MVLVHASVRRVQHNLEPLLHQSPEPSVAHTAPVPPDYQQGFLGGKNQPNSMQRKALFVLN